MSAQTPGFLPSDVQLSTPPLTSTCGHAETESALAVVVLGLAHCSNDWVPLRAKDLAEVITHHIDAGIEPLSRWTQNPFIRPDMGRLIAEGWATKSGPPDDESLELTVAAIEALRRWVRVPTIGHQGAP